ncbi:hypothetical protein, partial [Enterococcus faecium]
GAAKGTARPESFDEAALTLRKAAHRALDNVAKAIETLRFNVAVAHVHDYANSVQAALTGAQDKPGSAMAWALREAGEFLVQMIAPMMP